MEALIEEEEEEDPCSGKQCTANEHCCDGHVCVDVDEDDQNPGENTDRPIDGDGRAGARGQKRPSQVDHHPKNNFLKNVSKTFYR